MEEVKKDAAEKMVEHNNKGRDHNVIDLHGLQAKAVIETVEKFLKSREVDKSRPGFIITGKGSHSGSDGPKITAAIDQLLREKKIKYIGPVEGTFTVYF